MDFVNLKLVLVVFGSYKEISPNDIDFLKYIVDHVLPKGYMPSTIDEVSLNVDSSGTKTSNEKRLAINKMDNSTSLRILSDRIEVEYRNNHFPPIGTNSNNASAKALFRETVNFIKLIEDRFPNKKHNRLGVISTNILSKKSSETYNRNFSSKSNVGSDLLVEWNQKTVVRKQKKITDNSETLNISKEISFGIKNIVQNNKQPQKLNEVVIDLDINTIPENLDLRFSFDDINKFVDIALPMQDNIMSEILSSNK